MMDSQREFTKLYAAHARKSLVISATDMMNILTSLDDSERSACMMVRFQPAYQEILRVNYLRDQFAYFEWSDCMLVRV
jgi:hypothetical protein